VSLDKSPGAKDKIKDKGGATGNQISVQDQKEGG
jgi:hypothetical protein